MSRVLKNVVSSMIIGGDFGRVAVVDTNIVENFVRDSHEGIGSLQHLSYFEFSSGTRNNTERIFSS